MEYCLARKCRFIDTGENFWTTLAAEGRDPATLDVTVGINVAFPELGAEQGRRRRRGKSRAGRDHGVVAMERLPRDIRQQFDRGEGSAGAIGS